MFVEYHMNLLKDRFMICSSLLRIAQFKFNFIQSSDHTSKCSNYYMLKITHWLCSLVLFNSFWLYCMCRTYFVININLSCNGCANKLFSKTRINFRVDFFDDMTSEFSKKPICFFFFDSISVYLFICFWAEIKHERFNDCLPRIWIYGLVPLHKFVVAKTIQNDIDTSKKILESFIKVNVLLFNNRHVFPMATENVQKCNTEECYKMHEMYV